ncbi:MAG: electron transfer flavoprotein subunit beta/FixA family protein [Nitrospirae bacterium]|nr:electron transfer flavoprotein subunit beta/FixA family protein [Nitrospirota bacterium]MBF0540985.1 electron transfer flavoprotein subunit beta/FixA family protein [Nitrospirota bacterium]
MNIVVCVKQVPDTAEVKIDPKTNTLIRDGVPSIINPYDMHAIEAALEIKEKIGGTVTVLTMGPPQAETALRDAISLGADEAVLLSDRAFAGSDTWATAYTLAGAIKKIGFDIIICGKQAIDGDTAQVGPGIAEFLNIPHVAFVSKIKDITEQTLTLDRMMDDRYEIVEADMPVLFTVVKEINVPRLPSLKGKIKAKKIEIKKMTNAEIGLDVESLGLSGSPTQVKNIFAPDIVKDRKMLEGGVEEQVNQLMSVLKELKCV